MSCGFSSGTTSSSRALAPSIFIEHLRDARLWRTLPRRLCLSSPLSYFTTLETTENYLVALQVILDPRTANDVCPMETPDYFPVAIDQFRIYS